MVSATAQAASASIPDSPPRSRPERDNAPAPDVTDERERFIPVTRFALIDRLTEARAWPDGQAAQARRFFAYLDYWRQQQYGARLLELERDYEPFSPDSDLLMTRSYTEVERAALQKRVVSAVEGLLTQANYTRIDPHQVELILTRESHYGLDLHVDLDAFEELLVFYRGATTRMEHHRSWRTFMRKQELDVPIFRRLFVLFKLKPAAKRVEEMMRARECSRRQATRTVQRLRSLLPPDVRDDQIYIKLFKSIPRSDIEMTFPNTRVNFRPFDKLKLGITGGAGLGMSAFGAAGKLALVTTNPLAAAGAMFGIGGVIFRQCKKFLNQRQRYMVILAQNLYFHAMADNRGALVKLASRAAEEDTKEEILLYSVLAKEKVRPYVLLQLTREGAVRPTLAAFNEGCSRSRASSQEDEPWSNVASFSSDWTSRRSAMLWPLRRAAGTARSDHTERSGRIRRPYVVSCASWHVRACGCGSAMRRGQPATD